MRRLVLSICLWFGLSHVLQAEGVDAAFVKPVDQPTWGKSLRGMFSDTPPRSFALLVGISDYDEFSDLPTANDVEAMRAFLVEKAGYDHVHVLTEKKVSRRRIRELMIDEFPALMGPNDRFLFYWSGHGVTKDGRRKGAGGTPEKIGYLPLQDSRKGVFSSMLEMSDIHDWDRRHITVSQALYLLDSCFSGLADVTFKSDRAEALTLRQMSGPSRHIMTAGLGGEETIAIEQYGGSIFTIAVLEGIGGKADTTSAFARDGIVTVNELEDYVKKRVGQMVESANWPRQITPQLRDLDINEGEFFFRVPGAEVETEGSGNEEDDVAVSGKGKDDRDDILALLKAQQDAIDELTKKLADQNNDPTAEEELQSKVTKAVGTDTIRLKLLQEQNIAGSPEPFRDCPECPDMVVVPGGDFVMGGPGANERPLVPIEVGEFAVSQTEISLKQFLESGVVPERNCFVWTSDQKMRRSFVNDYSIPGWYEAQSEYFWVADPVSELDYERPAVCLSSANAEEFVDWINSRVDGHPYRLLSEAEFEYLMHFSSAVLSPEWAKTTRGGTSNDQLCQVANASDISAQESEMQRFPFSHAICDDGSVTAWPVEDGEPSIHGLKNILGNVWEWTADCWNENHAGRAKNGSARTEGDCTKRVVKGGSFDDPLDHLDPAYRVAIPAGYRQQNVGFRVAKDLP